MDNEGEKNESSDVIKELVAKNRADRQRLCEDEIAKILAKHECEFHTIQEWIDGKPGHVAIRLIAK